MKIVHILNGTDIGGTEKAVLNYISNNTDEVVENYVISFNGGTLDAKYNQIIENYKVTNTNNIIKNILSIYRFIKKYNIDIVYAYGLRTSIPARITTRVLNKKNIYGVRGLQKNNTGIIELINKLTLPFVDIIVTNSEEVKQSLINNFNYKENKIFTIYNGTYCPKTTKKYDYILGESLKIICIANLNPIKGHKYLLSAFLNLVEKGYNVELTLLGEGSERSIIIEFIEKHNLVKKVKVLGSVSDVYPHLYNHDLMILPSLSEGLPNAIMEGMACGLPVICTNVGGNTELIQNQKNGLVIEPKSISQIELAIEYLYHRPDEISKFGSRNREIVIEKFNFTRLVKENNSLFEKINNN